LLETRGLEDELAKLGNIPDDDVEAAKALCRFFHVGITDSQIEAAAYLIEFKRNELERLEHYKNLETQKQEIIRTYHNHTTLLADRENEARTTLLSSLQLQKYSRAIVIPLFILSSKWKKEI